MDPWYDFLAFPVAPLIIVLQAVALAWPGRRSMTVSAVCFAAVASMFVLVTVLLPFMLPGEGANIGAGLLLFEMLFSLMLLQDAMSWADGK